MLRWWLRAWAATSPRPGVQLQLVPLGQFGDELLVGVGFVSAQLVIEMDHRQDDTELRAQFQHDSQEGYGIGSARNGDPHAVARVEKSLTTDVVEDAFEYRAHANIVQPGVGRSSALALHWGGLSR